MDADEFEKKQNLNKKNLSEFYLKIGNADKLREPKRSTKLYQILVEYLNKNIVDSQGEIADTLIEPQRSDALEKIYLHHRNFGLIWCTEMTLFKLGRELCLEDWIELTKAHIRMGHPQSALVLAKNLPDPHRTEMLKEISKMTVDNDKLKPLTE